MSEWTHRATAQKTDAPRRNQTRWIDRMEKKPAPISYCPELSHLSPFLPLLPLSLSLSFSLLLPTRCFPSSIPDLCNPRVNVRRTERFSCRIFVRSGKLAYQGCHTGISSQRRQPPLAKIKRAHRSNADVPFRPLPNVKVFGAFSSCKSVVCFD